MRCATFLFGTPMADVRFDPLTETLTISPPTVRPGQRAQGGITLTGPDATRTAAALIVALTRQQAGEVLRNLLEPPMWQGAWNVAAGGWYRQGRHMVQRPETQMEWLR